jgi:hypothetical protein
MTTTYRSTTRLQNQGAWSSLGMYIFSSCIPFWSHIIIFIIKHLQPTTADALAFARATMLVLWKLILLGSYSKEVWNCKFVCVLSGCSISFSSFACITICNYPWIIPSRCVVCFIRVMGSWHPLSVFANRNNVFFYLCLWKEGTHVFQIQVWSNIAPITHNLASVR